MLTLNLIGRHCSKSSQSALWTERSFDTDDSIPTSEGDNSNKINACGIDGIEEHHKRLCEMASEAVSK